MCYNKILEFDSQFLLAYYHRGAAQIKLGNFKDARKDFLDGDGKVDYGKIDARWK